MIYLAMPYSSLKPEVVEARMKVFAKVAGFYILKGITVVSPLYNHFILGDVPGLETDWNAWEKYSKELLSKSQLLLIICLDGWKQSSGIAGEIRAAEQSGIPVFYLWDVDRPEDFSLHGPP